MLPGPAMSGDMSPGRGNTTNKGSGNKSRIHLQAGKAQGAGTMALSCAWGQAAVGVGVHRSLGNLPLLRQLRGLWPRGSHLDSPGVLSASVHGRTALYKASRWMPGQEESDHTWSLLVSSLSKLCLTCHCPQGLPNPLAKRRCSVSLLTRMTCGRQAPTCTVKIILKVI